MAFSFPTYHLYPLAWVALLPLLHSTYRSSVAESAQRFFVAGLIFYLMLLQWLLTNVYWAGGWAIWGYVALSVYMAGYWAGCGALWTWARARNGLVPQSLFLAGLWATMEFLQSTLFTGFGWGALAYSQANDLPFVQLASVGGTGLIAVALVLVNALLTAAFTEKTKRVPRLTIAVAIVAVAHATGYTLLDKPQYGDTPFEVALYQSAYPLEMKWDPEYTTEMVRNAVDKSERVAATGRVDLFVWPEALIMSQPTDPDVWELLRGLVTRTNAPLFTGTSREEQASGGYRNSSVFVSHIGEIDGYYDKNHLAPFGEYVPLNTYLPFISKVVPSIGDVEPGREVRTFSVGERRLGPLICFEVLFPQMAERLRRDGADFLTVVTNLAWFGTSNAIPQEIEIARLRCIETRLPMVHASNTGVSGVIDPYGRLSRLEQAQERGRLVQIGDRMAGALPLPKPARLVLPFGTAAFPWIALALTTLLAIIAASIRRRAS